MKCQECKKENFTVLLRVLSNGKIKTLKLCDACAKKKGYSYEDVPPLPQEYAEKIILHEYVASNKKKLKCLSCGTFYIDFSKNGKLGCPLCYFYFEKELKNIFERMGFGNYRGKSGHDLVIKEVERLNKKAIESLRKKIRICLQFNDFETAKKLQEELSKIENEKD